MTYSRAQMERDMVAEIKELTETETELRRIVKDLADELEAEVEHRYASTKDHPAMKDRYDRDMEAVLRARAALTTTPEGSE